MDEGGKRRGRGTPVPRGANVVREDAIAKLSLKVALTAITVSIAAKIRKKATEPIGRLQVDRVSFLRFWIRCRIW